MVRAPSPRRTSLAKGDEIQQAPLREQIHVRANTYTSQSFVDLQPFVHFKHTEDWRKGSQASLTTNLS